MAARSGSRIDGDRCRSALSPFRFRNDQPSAACLMSSSVHTLSNNLNMFLSEVPAVRENSRTNGGSRLNDLTSRGGALSPPDTGCSVRGARRCAPYFDQPSIFRLPARAGRIPSAIRIWFVRSFPQSTRTIFVPGRSALRRCWRGLRSLAGCSVRG